MNIGTKSLGLFGGTFDPIHDGHISVAREALKTLNLDKVVFVPAGDPYMKTSSLNVSPAFHRMEMINRALSYENDSNFCVSDIEIGRNGPSYTLETVETFNLPKDRLVVIIGADTLSSFHLWKEPEKIVSKARMAVITRPGVNISTIIANDDKGLLNNIEIIDSVTPNITSTQIRYSVKCGHIEEGVCPPVRNYIHVHQLYR